MLVLTAFIALALSLATGPAHAKKVLPEDAGCHFILGQQSWTVRWQARTSGEDGAFRLYAGQALGDLRIVDMQQATTGIGSYQFKDVPDGSAWLFYQLRYVSGDGEEIVLGTLRVDCEGLGQIPVSIDFGSHGLKALQKIQPDFALVSGRRMRALRITHQAAPAPRPEVPPPRSLSC